MSMILALPFAAQAALMGVDELWFHRRRGLPRWERIGHPVDTSSVAACLALAVWTPPEGMFPAIYATLAVLSCLLITKDEFVHAGRCSTGEHWIHAVLFMLHPVTLLLAAVLWKNADSSPAARVILTGQLTMIAAFLGYQVIYWNVARRS